MALRREDSVNQLFATIKDTFEQNGVLRDVRCYLQSKMVTLMQGNTKDANSLVKWPAGCGGSLGSGQRDTCTLILHQLIVEYLHWHGFFYTAEMFATESATENVVPLRQCLESILGHFDYPQLPILLELVAVLLERNKSGQQQHKEPEQQLP